jgi:hypothetical protein
MDAFKSEMQKKCGVGGIYCYCCNDYKGKRKKTLNRLARRKLQVKDKEDIKKS